MGWLSLALLSSAGFAVIAIADKKLISVMPSFGSVLSFIGLAVFCTGLASLAIEPLSPDIPLTLLLTSTVSGFLWGVGVLLVIYTLRYEEVSRAIPAYNIFPVFTAVLAVLFLGEHLSNLQWLSVLVTVAGAVTITIKPTSKGPVFSLGKPFVVLMIGAFVTALAYLVTKYVVTELSLWNAFSLRSFGLAVPFLLFIRPNTVRHIAKTMLLPVGSTYILLEIFLGPLCMWVTLSAIQAGPLALVTAVTGTRSLFVVVFSAILSTRWLRILEEPIDHRTITLKLASTSLIVGGVIGLNFL